MADMLTTAQAAERMRVTVKTIVRMARDGRLEYITKLDGIRGTFLFDSDVIERAAAERAEQLRAKIPA